MKRAAGSLYVAALVYQDRTLGISPGPHLECPSDWGFHYNDSPLSPYQLSPVPNEASVCQGEFHTNSEM